MNQYDDDKYIFRYTLEIDYYENKHSVSARDLSGIFPPRLLPFLLFTPPSLDAIPRAALRSYSWH